MDNHKDQHLQLSLHLQPIRRSDHPRTCSSEKLGGATTGGRDTPQRIRTSASMLQEDLVNLKELQEEKAEEEEEIPETRIRTSRKPKSGPARKSAAPRTSGRRKLRSTRRS